MPASIRNSAGTDLDSIFEPLQGGDDSTYRLASAVGYRDSSGVDLKDKYVVRAKGGAAAAVSIRDSSGNDLNAVFAAIGTVTRAGVTNPLPSVVGYRDNSGGEGSSTASLQWSTDGVIYGSFGQIGSGSEAKGDWYTPTTAGAGNSLYLKIVVQNGIVSGLTSGTWYLLNTQRAMTRGAPASQYAESNGTYSISTTASDAGIIRSGSWTLWAQGGGEPV